MSKTARAAAGATLCAAMYMKREENIEHLQTRLVIVAFRIVVIVFSLSCLFRCVALRPLSAPNCHDHFRFHLLGSIPALAHVFTRTHHALTLHLVGSYARESSRAFADAQVRLFEAQARECDIIVTTALIPGRAAPKLITAVRACLGAAA
jgi:hypothetical protein